MEPTFWFVKSRTSKVAMAMTFALRRERENLAKCRAAARAKTSEGTRLGAVRDPRPRLSVLDLDVDTGGEIELHQCVEGLLRRIEDVQQALVRADLELLARLLVDERAPKNRIAIHLRGER